MTEKKDYSKAPYEVGKGKPPKNRIRLSEDFACRECLAIYIGSYA